jgi:hypothetical protein
MDAAWVTQHEAARLLGVHVSLIPKMLRRGDLSSRRARPSLSRAEVLELADARERARVERARRDAASRPAGPRPPDDEHDWLLGPAAAAVLGCSQGALGMRASRGRVPFTVHRGRRWYRLDLLELVVRARVARARGRVAEV